jgi:hypothetical protein
MTNGAPERDITPVHHVGAIGFGDDGPARLDANCWYNEDGRFAGQWLVSVDILPHEDLVDKDNPDQWDADNDQVIPESAWAMPATQARQLAALIVAAADAAELFQDGELFSEGLDEWPYGQRPDGRRARGGTENLETPAPRRGTPDAIRPPSAHYHHHHDERRHPQIGLCMAGQHIEREARYAATGLTPAQRDKLIWEWHSRGYSFQKIGDHLKMSKSAVKYIFDRLSGTPRVQTGKQSDMCQGCWGSFPRNQLNSDGLCLECTAAAPD